jgi:hypothetical protein
MKSKWQELKERANQASDFVANKAPGAKELWQVATKVVESSTDAAKRTLGDAAEKASALVETTREHELTKEIARYTSNAASVTADKMNDAAHKMANALRGISADENLNESAAQPPDEERKIEKAVDKLKGRDKLGVAGDGLAAAGGAAAGVAAAGTIAGAAGATTLFGSTTLAGALGGIFVTTTPVGWIIGSAALVGAAGYVISKLIRSGAKQDQVRKDLIERLNKRLQSIRSDSTNKDALTELNQLLTVAIASELIQEDQASRMVALIEKGLLDPHIALTRIRALAVSANVIQTTAQPV